MLELQSIRLTQGEFTLSVDCVIPLGSRVAVIGPSGAGKSTLLSLIGGFEAPDMGRLLWNGQDLTKALPHERPISHLFQDNNLFGHMTAAENVGLGIRPSLRLTKTEQARVSEALSSVGLSGMEARRPAELSGGQQSRVALARVLVQEKPLILLDEPFSALGPAMRGEMIGLAKEVSAKLGATMLMVTHDIADVDRFADLVIWIEDGRCLPPRDWAEMKADPPEGLKAYIGT
ncbi:thiamine ABC transporter ATP-binding protein [Celeribacter ethanolicus]|uniref:Thiamine ABC transporter ATP-binding protein n=1 Tax=Celeribacter ethanolicus TaxID=1758178 RepID=A0A291GE51_9RHOB|nr:ATP-binding cassette domain-containing protein [Celeribacter ethanolicus]ATG48296.1 thiamine ABC transporter ATP-binding protein [Celeribacter ethanolicus]TNE64517.1 MAG: ATP-binding cassette domain-containing protein [Paracoccaceae bacterium]